MDELYVQSQILAIDPSHRTTFSKTSSLGPSFLCDAYFFPVKQRAIQWFQTHTLYGGVENRAQVEFERRFTL